MRPPRRLQELALDVRRSYDELNATNGSPPTAAQIAAYSGVSVEDVLEAQLVYNALHADSLDRRRPSRDDAEPRALIDTIGGRDLLDTLDERDRMILKLYYQEDLTQSQIGLRLGYSQMHISRLLRQAVEELLDAASRGERRLSPQSIGQRA